MDVTGEYYGFGRATRSLEHGVLTSVEQMNEARYSLEVSREDGSNLGTTVYFLNMPPFILHPHPLQFLVNEYDVVHACMSFPLRHVKANIQECMLVDTRTDFAAVSEKFLDGSLGRVARQLYCVALGNHVIGRLHRPVEKVIQASAHVWRQREAADKENVATEGRWRQIRGCDDREGKLMTMGNCNGWR